MGKKLDFLMGRTFKTSKFKTLAKLAIARITILKKQRQVRSYHARSDVIELLNLGHQESALLRVEHLIKEQNMLDVFFMIESNCHLLIERVKLIQNKECPDELEEAISSLILAASRCGEFPELQEMRKVFASWFGIEFAARAAELPNNCGVNPKIIQKFSARQPSLESRMKMLKEIASENGITLHLEEDVYTITKGVGQQQQQQQHQQQRQWIPPHLEGDSHVNIEGRLDNNKQNQLETNKSNTLDNYEVKEDTCDLPNIKREETLSESTKARKKYRDVAAAAEEAFESAAYAAVAARAAMELFISESRDNDSDDHNSCSEQHEILTNSVGSLQSKLHIVDDAAPKEEPRSNCDKIHPIDNFNYDSEVEEMAENNYRTPSKESEKRNKKGGMDASILVSEGGDNLGEKRISPDKPGQIEPLGKETINDGSDGETRKGNIPWVYRDLVSDRLPSFPNNEYTKIKHVSAAEDEVISNKDANANYIKNQSPKPQKYQADHMAHYLIGKSMSETTHSLNSVKQLCSQHSNIESKPVSVRTRRVYSNLK